MKKILQSTILLLAVAAPVFAASATDFYVALLRRGIADVDAGRNAEATMNLRLAAFGLIDSIEHYEHALAYLTVAFDRLGNAEQARETAARIIAAEKVEKKFRGIALPAAIRTSFDAAAKKVLSASDAAALSGGATAKPSEPVIVDRVEVKTEKAGAATTTKPAASEPAKPPAPKPQTSNTTTTPAKTSAPATKPQPQPAKPAPQQPAKTIDVAAKLNAADAALTKSSINEARRLYREVLVVPGLDHATAIRLAEGFYRSRDFVNALTAFERVGTLRPGEEPYRYYIAVAAFEVGQFDRARRELAAALPFIEATPDVQRYRAKIEAAR
jgi:tetratricopeptide (TPR) repeat protein